MPIKDKTRAFGHEAKYNLNNLRVGEARNTARMDCGDASGPYSVPYVLHHASEFSSMGLELCIVLVAVLTSTGIRPVPTGWYISPGERDPFT